MFVERLSLSVRLALIFALGSLAALLVATNFHYWAFRHELKARNWQALEGHVQEVSAILLGRPDDRRSLEEEILGEPEPRLWLRVLEDGRILLETPGMREVLPMERFEGRPRARSGHHRYILRERTVGRRRIQGALEVTGDERLLDSYWRRLVYTMVFGTVGCAALGWWSARRGLRPLRRIAESTRGITAQSLRERLEPGQVPPELRDLVLSLNAMLDRLDRAFERLGRFSSDLAHELRTPITNLMGETEVVLSRERTAGDYRQVLESSMEEYRRLSRLISRMLFLARAEDPRAAVARATVEAGALVEEVLAFFEAAAEEQGVRLEGEGTGTIHGDADLLRQALANLVSNALAATPPGGLVTVRAVADGAPALLEVQDTGCGVPAEELPRILDRFYRTPESLEHKRPGTGLGLAIVQSIARLHGGDFQITSEPGRGTSARILIPC